MFVCLPLVELEISLGELLVDYLHKRLNMKTKEKICVLYNKIDDKFVEQFGFNVRNVTFDKIVDYMYTPKDVASLAITRILFGLAMLFDIPSERGGAAMPRLWADPNICHFPLFPILQPMPLPYMALVYAGLWFGALGIMLGYKFSVSARMFTVCYWYLFLVEKVLWNNHSYLFGLVALLISCTDAGCYWSIDTYLDPSKKKLTVPYWNYFILKYQFFILYFMAGMKKSAPEWLAGYSLPKISEHWVFKPFTYFLTVAQTDYLVVHVFVFMFDLTVAVWMMWASTRHVAMIFCALFHLMNSRLFAIGMFPWVCLATMPLFYPFDWPRRVAYYSKKYYTKVLGYIHSKMTEFKKQNICECKSKILDDDISDNMNESTEDSTKKCIEFVDESLQSMERTYFDKTVDKTKEITHTENADLDKLREGCDSDAKDNKDQDNVSFKAATKEKDPKKKTTIYLIAFYVFMQAFLPYSHFITKGYNNWTSGLYGYSWDMMVHHWEGSNIVVKVVDNDRNEEFFIESALHTLNDKWSRHGDMLYQYAHCLKKKLETKAKEDSSKLLSKNISIYIDIWQGMNGRFVQRMFNPKVDMLKANWSPFSAVPYLMPLLDEALHWRKDLAEIREQVHAWNNYSDVVFVADFPGYEQEKFIPFLIKNVTLTILEGTVVYEIEVPSNRIGRSYKFTRNDRIRVTNGQMHKVTNIGETPAFYMYTFYTEPSNTTADIEQLEMSKRKMPIFKELYELFYRMFIFINLLFKYLFEMFKFSQCN